MAKAQNKKKKKKTKRNKICYNQQILLVLFQHSKLVNMYLGLKGYKILEVNLCFYFVLGGIKVQDKLPVDFKLNLLFRNLSHTWFTDFYF